MDDYTEKLNVAEALDIHVVAVIFSVPANYRAVKRRKYHNETFAMEGWEEEFSVHALIPDWGMVREVGSRCADMYQDRVVFCLSLDVENPNCLSFFRVGSGVGLSYASEFDIRTVCILGELAKRFRGAVK